MLIAEEETIAGRAEGDTSTRELFFSGNIHMTVFRTGRQDDAASQEGFILKGDLLDVAFELQRVGILVANISTELFGLLTHIVHQLRAEDTLGETGEVLNFSRVHQRATGSQGTGNDNRLESSARSVNSRSVSRRTGADDDDVVDSFRHDVSF